MEPTVVTTSCDKCCTDSPPTRAFLRVSAPQQFYRIVTGVSQGKGGGVALNNQFNLRNYIINLKQISLLQDSWRFHLLMYKCEYPRGWHKIQLFLNSLGQGSPFWKSFLRGLFHLFNINQKPTMCTRVSTQDSVAHRKHTQSFSSENLYSSSTGTRNYYLKLLFES